MTLVQHLFPDPNPSLGAVPGRLYYNGELVPMRSDLEVGLLSLLRGAEVSYSESHHDQRIQLSPNALILGEDIRQVLTRKPEDNIRALLAAVIEFVESEGYLQFAERVEQAADLTLYTVWLAWDIGTRNQVIVRLGRVLGIGLQAASQFLDSDRSLAKDVTAQQVAELAKQYSAEGLALRVEPAFRWHLS